jgi:hypothetical protein
MDGIRECKDPHEPELEAKSVVQRNKYLKHAQDEEGRLTCGFPPARPERSEAATERWRLGL